MDASLNNTYLRHNGALFRPATTVNPRDLYSSQGSSQSQCRSTEELERELWEGMVREGLAEGEFPSGGDTVPSFPQESSDINELPDFDVGEEDFPLQGEFQRVVGVSPQMDLSSLGPFGSLTNSPSGDVPSFTESSPLFETTPPSLKESPLTSEGSQIQVGLTPNGTVDLFEGLPWDGSFQLQEGMTAAGDSQSPEASPPSGENSEAQNVVALPQQLAPQPQVGFPYQAPPLPGQRPETYVDRHNPLWEPLRALFREQGKIPCQNRGNRPGVLLPLRVAHDEIPLPENWRQNLLASKETDVHFYDEWRLQRKVKVVKCYIADDVGVDRTDNMYELLEQSGYRMHRKRKREDDDERGRQLRGR